MRLNQLAINQRVTVVVFLFIIAVGGIYSYVSLPREAAPEVIVPLISVVTSYQGVSPEDIESLVTIPIERKLTGISGIKEIRSRSLESVSVVLIEFVSSTDITGALQKVRDKVDLARQDLPQEAEEPVISEINISEMPILIMCLTGPIGPAALNKIAEDLEDRFEAIKGVLDVAIIGGVEREIEIEVDPERVARYGVSLSNLALLTRLENVNTPSGAMELGEAKFLMRVPGEFKTPDELTGLIVKATPQGIVYLRDIATIRDRFKDPVTYSRMDGTPAVTLTLAKRSGENIIAVADQVNKVLGEMRKKFPPGVDVAITMDSADFVRDMVAELENGMLSGLILVLAVIILSMGITNAIFIALAIPVSMCITLIILKMTGVTLNMVVLYSLILVLGNLVDVSIVVVENTYRHIQAGMGRVEAAYRGASEVSWPIIGSTLTTVAGFFPLLFWPGVMGDFMFYLPQTVSIALLASLFVGMVVNPALAAMWMPAAKLKRDKDGHVKLKRHPILRIYGRILRTALQWRLVTTVLFLTVVASIVVVYAAGAKVEFMPDTEPRHAYIDIDCPQGTKLDTSDTFVREIEARIQPEKKNVLNFIANVGSHGVEMFSHGDSTTSHENRININFPKLEKSTELPTRVLNNIRNLAGQIPGAEIRVKKEEEMGPPTGPPVNIEISGDDFETLAKLAMEIKRKIKDVPGLVDLDDDYDTGKPEVRVNVDRQRAYLAGLNTQFVGATVKAAISGLEAGEYREGDKEYDVMVRFPKWFREDLRNVETMNLINLQGTAIPFSAVAKIEQGGGLSRIMRINRKRTLTVFGEVEGMEAPQVLKLVQEKLKDFPLPAGYSISYTGENEDFEEAQDFLSKAFVVALLLVTLVMVAEFNSLMQPLIIMTTVVLSVAGVLFALLVFDMPFDVLMTGIACISLAGVVVNNGIVLLDFINVKRAQGMPSIDAIVEGATTRFRPVMLTAITTVIGLVPMAAGVSFNFRDYTWTVGGESSQWWGPMAIAVIVGLLFATLLTLFVVPTLYSYYDSAKGFFRSKRRQDLNHEAPAAP